MLYCSTLPPLPPPPRRATPRRFVLCRNHQSKFSGVNSLPATKFEMQMLSDTRFPQYGDYDWKDAGRADLFHCSNPPPTSAPAMPIVS